MKRLIVYISLILPLAALPAESWGQFLVLENSSAFIGPVLYADGLHPNGLWEIGRRLRDENTGATIRHTVNAGNGQNINVNSKLPRRLVIAPTDATRILEAYGTKTDKFDWASAMGFGESDNNSLSPESNSNKSSGCYKYVPPTGSRYNNMKWRLPTQRELAFIWLFHTYIDQAFYNAKEKWLGLAYPYDVLKDGYWTSTESDETHAYFLDFGSVSINFSFQWPDVGGYGTRPRAGTATKGTSQLKVRCVADY